MTLTDEQKRKRRITTEKKRLQKIYKDLDSKRQDLAVGLIENAAYTRVKIQDLTVFLDENGLTEMFSQSDKQEPYSRKRPEADLYNTMSNNYLKYIKQLNDLLPKDTPKPDIRSDGFDVFVDERDRE